MDPGADSFHPSNEDLTAFAVGKLAEMPAAVIERHIARCNRCATAVAVSPDDDFVALLSELQHARSTATGHGPAAPGSPTEAAPAQSEDGTRLLLTALREHERYRVIRWLAEGGMGAVFLAEHRLLRIPVAIKSLRANRSQDRKSLERFLQEAKVAARLDHVNIARVFDAEQVGDILFLAIEYVPGKTLAQVVMKKGPLPVATACDYIRQTAEGLEHAASRGVIHRDIKPQNLMLMAPQGTIKILDFGLGRLVDEERTHGRLTANDDILGTPHFIAPEQIRDSRSADARSDLYGLGCTFYYLLAGEAPFRGKNPLELLEKHATEPPPSIRSMRRDVPEEIDRLIRALLAKDPRARPQSPREFMDELLRSGPSSSKSVRPVAVKQKGPATATLPSAGKRFVGKWFFVSPVVYLPIVTILLTLAVLILVYR